LTRGLGCAIIYVESEDKTMEEKIVIFTFDEALANHLKEDFHYSYSLSLVPVCKKAIELGNEMKWFEMVKLPDGMARIQLGKPEENIVPVWWIVDRFQLHAWINPEAIPQNNPLLE
jgi:hypothetical protein